MTAKTNTRMQGYIEKSIIAAMVVFGLAFIISNFGIVTTGAMALTYTESQFDIAPTEATPASKYDIQNRASRHIPTTVWIRVGHADWRDTVKALHVDAARHGGEVNRTNKLLWIIPNGTTLSVSEAYAQHLVELSQQNGPYLNTGYVAWGNQTAAGKTNPNLKGPPDVEVRVKVFPMPSGNPPLQKAMQLSALAWAISGLCMAFTLMLTFMYDAIATTLHPKVANESETSRRWPTQHRKTPAKRGEK